MTASVTITHTTLTRPLFRATKRLTGDDGNEYGREHSPERAGDGVEPGARGDPKILPEPPAESEGREAKVERFRRY